MCFDLVLWQGVGVGWGVPLPKVRSPSGCGGVGGWKWLGPWGLDMVCVTVWVPPVGRDCRCYHRERALARLTVLVLLLPPPFPPQALRYL